MGAKKRMNCRCTGITIFACSCRKLVIGVKKLKNNINIMRSTANNSIYSAHFTAVVPSNPLFLLDEPQKLRYTAERRSKAEAALISQKQASQLLKSHTFN